MRRKLAILALVLAATVIAAQAKPTMAASSWVCHCFYTRYYTDATKTVQCGYETDCGCETGGSSSGCNTPYFTRSNATQPCCP
jgi:hypothetical protein